MLRTINNLTDFEKEILKQEIDLIDKTIARIDHIQSSLKGWTITIWGGSLYLIAQHLNKSENLVLLTAIIPLLFGGLDLIWSKQMLIVNYREEKISAFINGELDDDRFPLLDPIAKKYGKQPDYKKNITWKKAISHKYQLVFYLALIMVSIVLAISIPE